MLSQAIATIILLVVMVVAMASQRVRTDIIALLVLLFLIISGILEDAGLRFALGCSL